MPSVFSHAIAAVAIGGVAVGGRSRAAIWGLGALCAVAPDLDVVVSFETLEHLPGKAQASMIGEFARVLAPQGVLVISSPNRPQYSDARAGAIASEQQLQAELQLPVR